jgi:hypothetical protein
MGTTVNQRTEEETISTVLSWNERDRAKLTYRLLLSLEDTSLEESALSREELERLWADEAHRRLSDFEAGKIGAVPREEAMRLAREGLVK